LGNGTVGVTGRRFFRPQGFSVIARLLMLWMIGGSWKSTDKKTEKIHFPKIIIQNGGKNAVWERRETGQ